MSSPILQLRDLRVRFPGEPPLVAVDGVSLELHEGEVLGLVGESGSGKTVTALSIIGLLPPGARVEGQVLFRGRDLLRLSPAELHQLRGRAIAMNFQNPGAALNPYLAVCRQVAEVLVVHEGYSWLRARKRALELLDRVGVPEPELRARYHPHQLSQGQKQRVVLAMALAAQPAVLLADEPTTGQDAITQIQVVSLLRDLARETGTAVLFITHNLGLLAGAAEDVAVMYAGRIVERAPTAELFRYPLHPYTRGLLDSLPRLDRRRKLAPIQGLPPDPRQLGPGCAFAPRCPRAGPECRESRPELRALPGRRHLLACHRAPETEGGAA